MKLTKQERRKEQYLDLFILSILGLIVFLCFHWRFILWGGFYCLGWSSHYSAVGEVVVKAGNDSQQCRIFKDTEGNILIGPYRFHEDDGEFTDFIFLGRQLVIFRTHDEKNDGDWATFLSHLFIVLDMRDNSSMTSHYWLEPDIEYHGKTDSLTYKIRKTDDNSLLFDIEFEFSKKYFME